MLHKVFSIYDSKAEIFRQPFMSPTAGTAIRDFELAVNEKDSMLNKYPADYTLFEIGVWDDNNCEYIIHESKVSLGMAIEYLKED